MATKSADKQQTSGGAGKPPTNARLSAEELQKLDAYWRAGFYIFEGVLGQEELDDIERDVADMLD